MKRILFIILTVMMLVPSSIYAQVGLDISNSTPIVPVYGASSDDIVFEIDPNGFTTPGEGTICWGIGTGYDTCWTAPNDRICKTLCGYEWYCPSVECFQGRCQAQWWSVDHYIEFRNGVINAQAAGSAAAELMISVEEPMETCEVEE